MYLNKHDKSFGSLKDVYRIFVYPTDRHNESGFGLTDEHTARVLTCMCLFLTGDTVRSAL